MLPSDLPLTPYDRARWPLFGFAEEDAEAVGYSVLLGSGGYGSDELVVTVRLNGACEVEGYLCASAWLAAPPDVQDAMLAQVVRDQVARLDDWRDPHRYCLAAPCDACRHYRSTDS